MNREYKLRPTLDMEFKMDLIGYAIKLHESRILSKKQCERCIEKINDRYGGE